jgi:signal transduction histidine kinase
LFAGTLLEAFDRLARQDVEGQATCVLEETDYLRLRQTALRLSRGLVEANRHVHELSYGIMPVQIDAEGLRSALQELAAATDLQQDVTCWFTCPDPVTVPNNIIATHLYRIAQEALNNALRHAQADRVRISLFQKDGHIVLEVSDNGIGFDAGATHRIGPAGIGLRTMHYRASLIGGVVHIGRADEGGTLVRCTVLRGGGSE